MLPILLALLVAAPAAPSSPASLAVRGPIDSLPAALRRIETSSPSARDRAEAAEWLGRYHYARGEYREALDAFATAAARMSPQRKGEALYWSGLSWLGLRNPVSARAALEVVATSASPRRDAARLGIAQAWDMAGRPDRARDALEPLVTRGVQGAGDVGASALELYATLSQRLGHPRDADRARARLTAQYPQSMESAVVAAVAAMPDAPAREAGPVGLEAGAFSSNSRARALAQRAVRAGFEGARVVQHGTGGSARYAVLLGSYPDEREAREAQARAQRELGITARIGNPK